MTDTVVISQPVTTTLLYSTEQGPPGFTDVSPVIKLTGDLIANGTTGSAGVLTSLATTGVTAGTYGSANQLPVFTVDTKGRLTSAANTIIQLNASAIVAGTLGTSLLPAFSGDVSSAEGTTTLTLANSGITAGTYTKVTFNAKGIATSGSTVTAIADSGILDVYSKTEVDQAILNGTPSFLTLTNKPITLAGYGINDAYTKAETDALVGSTAVSWSTLTGKPNTIAGYNITDAISTSMIGTDIASLVSGKIPSTQLPSYVDDVIEGSTLAAFPAIGETGKIYVALDTGLTYRWSGSAYIYIGGTTTDAGNLTSGTLNAARLPALTGDDVTSTAGSGVLTLSSTTVIPGTYNSVTVDQKGRVTAGSNPAITAESVVISVLNQTGASIPKGSAVYITGANGDNPTVTLASASAESTSSKTLGITSAAIADGASGTVITFGMLLGVDTHLATAGSSVWLSTIAGQLTFGSPPIQPNHAVFLGKVCRQQQNNGSIFVTVQNGYELEELHNVGITSPANNEVLAYDSTSGLWKNKIAASSYTLPAATTLSLGGVIVDGTTITVDPAGKITAVGGGGTGAFATFTIADGELSVEHSSSFTLSLVDGEFIAEYN